MKAAKSVGSDCLDRFLQFLGGAEGDFLARLDLDWLAGRGIASHARSALADLQNAETDHADSLALLEMTDNRLDQIIEHGFGLLLRHVMPFRELRRDVLQRHRCRFSICHGCTTPFAVLALASATFSEKP